MTHTIIHRYRFTAAEVVDALGITQDCAAWTVSVDAGGVVVDIVEPGQAPPEPHPALRFENAQIGASGLENNNEIKGDGIDSPEPELKGGPLAARAAICCNEAGFRTFLGVKTADEARADVCRRCGVESRRMIDHDETAAAIWRDIDGKYRLWLEGHDVELD